jgi:hypothetical protein
MAVAPAVSISQGNYNKALFVPKGACRRRFIISVEFKKNYEGIYPEAGKLAPEWCDLVYSAFHWVREIP